MLTLTLSFCVSEMTNSARPALESALIRAPMSVLRVVTMASNGAVRSLKSASTSRRSTLALVALVRGLLSVRSPTTTTPNTRRAAMPAMARPRPRLRGAAGEDSGGMGNSRRAGGRDRLGVVPVNDAEDDGNEDERGDRRKNQATDDGSPERCVLLAALAQAQRHGGHADDHGERGHQHRAEAHIAGVECSRGGIPQLGQPLTREAHHH